MPEVAQVAILMVATIVVPGLVQWADRRRLPPEARARAWNVATWGAALYGFGPLSMLGWVFVTRPWPRRVLVAVPAVLVPGAILVAIENLLSALGPPKPPSAPAEPPVTVEEPVSVEEIVTSVVVVSLVVILVMLVVEGIARSWRRLKALRASLTGAVITLTLLTLTLVTLGSTNPAFAREEAPWPPPAPPKLPPGPEAWRDLRVGAIRGITVGPIENRLHPEGGYGTPRGEAALREAKALGATWVAITPFGRVWDLSGGGLDLSFEAPVEQNTRDVATAIRQAHALGLRVMLVPHLWVETGGWRALIHPEDDEGWARWAARYRTFLFHWADMAEREEVEMLSAGVEMRRWVTTRQAHRFVAILRELRSRYSGLVTYSANWDDLEYTTVLGELDVIGVNAFYPLTQKENATIHDLILGGEQVGRRLQVVAEQWGKPVVLTEMGYTTRRDPALKPWLWPDGMDEVVVDQRAQAKAYAALLAPLTDVPACAGFFAWRTYADPGDVSQEAEWGFSPRGKLAELILRDAFTATWAADGDPMWAAFAGLDWQFDGPARWGGHRARTPGIHAWETSPPLTFPLPRLFTAPPPR